MRVIAGTARSMPLKTPEGLDTRPTTDRIKETLFNILQNDVPGAVFVDLFSGSGAIGIEALSRGARKAYFIENASAALNAFNGNFAENYLEAGNDIIVYADIDYATIIDLINQNDFIDSEGNPTYSSVLFCWYVNPDFWQFQYNEKLIASLYFNLELEKYQGYVTTQVWHARGDGIKVNKRYPFGTKNLCRSMNFMLQQY